MSFILHHYPWSPYAEKIRAMFGYTNSEWASCLTSEAPPRGKLDVLSGGYNRIPVAQLGADIFCDSNIIADEIAAKSKQKALANQQLPADDLALRQWIESKLFFACVNRAFSVTLLRKIAAEKGVWKLLSFLKDRIEMGAKASISMGSPKSAPKYISQGIDKILAAMSTNEFVGGAQPNLIDFAAYHCFWFLTELGQKPDINEHKKMRSWYLRMQAYSSKPARTISIEQALDEAKSAKPRRLAKRYTSDHRIGSTITITPSDYRKIPVTGTLVGVDEHRWIIARESPETGKIHLHFPTSSVDVLIRLESKNY